METGTENVPGVKGDSDVSMTSTEIKDRGVDKRQRREYAKYSCQRTETSYSMPRTQVKDRGCVTKVLRSGIKV